MNNIVFESNWHLFIEMPINFLLFQNGQFINNFTEQIKKTNFDDLKENFAIF